VPPVEVQRDEALLGTIAQALEEVPVHVGRAADPIADAQPPRRQAAPDL
jgi:hypothetical protein